MKVTISRDEIVREPPPWPRASYENTVAVLMARKGLRLRPSFDPKPDNLLPPWQVEEDRGTGTITIWQGDIATANPSHSQDTQP